MNVKRILNYALIVILVASFLSIWILYSTNRKLKEDYSIATNNIKAYDLSLSKEKSNSRVFQLTIDQLNYFNDSIITKLNTVRQELNIKDKNLKQLQYLLSEANKVDTVTFTDTLFKDTNLNIDTLIKDDWHSLKLGLRYPSTIIASPTFISEKYIITSTKKETINPPKKFFLFRWFQRKHIVLEVQVVEKNPYIINKEQRFIDIID